MAIVATPAQQLAFFQLWLLLTTNTTWNHPEIDVTTLTPEWIASLPASITDVISQPELEAIFKALRSTDTLPNVPDNPTFWDVLNVTQQTFHKVGTGQLTEDSAARYDPNDPDCPPGFASIMKLSLPDSEAAPVEADAAPADQS